MFFSHPRSPFDHNATANRMESLSSSNSSSPAGNASFKYFLTTLNVVGLTVIAYLWLSSSVSAPIPGIAMVLLFINGLFLIRQTLRAKTNPFPSTQPELSPQLADINQLGYWEIDLETQGVLLCKEAQRLLDYRHPAHQSGPEHLFPYIHPQDLSAFQNILHAEDNDQKDFQIEIRSSKLAQTHYLLLKGKKEKREGKKARLYGILLGVDAYKQREQELEKARQTAESMSHSKSEFLSSMSHEIRTPMNAIIGLTDMLLQEELKPQVMEHLRIIKYSSDNLLALINDILDLSKIEAGKVSFEQVEFDLYRQMHDLCNSIGFKARAKGLRLNCYLQEGLPKVLIGDPYRLNQILFNLTSNAIKFTHEGNINIRVVPASLVEDGKIAIQFIVEDSGIGIPEEKLHFIFEKFEQASSNITREYGGTGLGLSITKKLVELQNGRITATSLEGKGSVFTIYLSFGVSKKAALAAVPPSLPHEDKNLTGVRLLMIEDNTFNQLVAKRLLNRWKAEIDVANNGMEALTLLRQHAYDVILMDIHLPGMNGYEITQLIRSGKAQVRNASIPIIALTADAFPEIREKTRQAGMNDWVVKPFDQNLFYEAILNNLPDHQEIIKQSTLSKK